MYPHFTICINYSGRYAHSYTPSQKIESSSWYTSITPSFFTTHVSMSVPQLVRSKIRSPSLGIGALKVYSGIQSSDTPILAYWFISSSVRSLGKTLCQVITLVVSSEIERLYSLISTSITSSREYTDNESNSITSFLYAIPLFYIISVTEINLYRFVVVYNIHTIQKWA